MEWLIDFLFSPQVENVQYGIAPILLAGAGIKIGAKLAGGLIGNRARKREQRNAQAGYDKQISRLENLDTSNPYANMQNTYEDATVNQQQSQFLAQQQQAALANTMSDLSGAAGGSGIAALAQSMASQQSANLQQASVDIGQQEQQNQMQQMAQQAQLDQLEVKGDMMSRQMEAAKGSGMLKRATHRLGMATQDTMRAKKSMMAGVGNLVGVGMQRMKGGALAGDWQSAQHGGNLNRIG